MSSLGGPFDDFSLSFTAISPRASHIAPIHNATLKIHPQTLNPHPRLRPGPGPGPGAANRLPQPPPRQAPLPDACPIGHPGAVHPHSIFLHRPHAGALSPHGILRLESGQATEHKDGALRRPYPATKHQNDVPRPRAVHAERRGSSEPGALPDRQLRAREDEVANHRSH